MIRALFQGRPVAAAITVLCAVSVLMACAAGARLVVIAGAVALAPTVVIVVLAIVRRKPRTRGAQQ